MRDVASSVYPQPPSTNIKSTRPVATDTDTTRARPPRPRAESWNDTVSPISKLLPLSMIVTRSTDPISWALLDLV